jgi:hypothetical protein
MEETMALFGRADSVRLAAVHGGFSVSILGDRLVLAGACWPGAQVQARSYPLPCAPEDVVALSAAVPSLETKSGDVWVVFGDEPKLTRFYNVLDLARELKP